MKLLMARFSIDKQDHFFVIDNSEGFIVGSLYFESNLDI